MAKRAPSKIKRDIARLQAKLSKLTAKRALKAAAPAKNTVSTFAKAMKGAAPVKKTVNTFAKVKKGHDSGYKEMLEKFMVITKPSVVVVVT